MALKMQQFSEISTKESQDRFKKRKTALREKIRTGPGA